MVSKRAGLLLDASYQLHHTLSLSDLCEDVILLICDHLQQMRSAHETPLLNLSCVNHRLRDILIPHLFKTLSINKPVSQLQPTTITSHHASTLKIDMFGSLWWWCSGSYTSSSDATDLFACIQSMRKLQRLEISMMRRSIDIFRAAFESEADIEAFRLNEVEDLVVTSSAAFLTNHCPNLKRLVVKDDESECLLETYTDLLRRLTPLHPGLVDQTPSLTSFDATAVWSAAELSSLVSTFPDLQHLRMRSDTYCYRASTPTIIKILGNGLKNLKSLQLVKTGSLGMGYLSVWKRRIHSCSDAEYRQALWKENERLRVYVENEIVRNAFTWIHKLRECYLGEKRVARRCDGCGNEEDKMWWMWERMKENVEECFMDSLVLAKYRMEKESVVVSKELGF
jgi:hypothetical protein